MSNYDFILKSLNLKDDSVIFNEIPFTELIIKGVRSFVYHAKLIGKPDFCEQCGVVYENHNMISKGYSKPSMIKLPKVSGFNTYLELTKQRYHCKECGSSFTKRTRLVNKYCFISNNTKISIVNSFSLKISEKDIAQINNVSPSTVKIAIDRIDSDKKIYKHSLPKVMGFDEFKSVKSADGAMSFIYCDLEKKNIIDIVEDRRLFKLKNHFSYYSTEAKENVETIVIDMYTPYIQLIKSTFPNAKIVIDRFHIVQHLSRSFQKTRIQVMKKFNTKSTEYRLYKKHWRLFTTKESKLSSSLYRRWWRDSKQMNQKDFLNHLLTLDDSLYKSYWLYQSFLKAIENNDIKKIKEILELDLGDYPEPIQKAVKTFRSFLPYIINMLESEYNNGFVEGVNNLIKVIKRISFGYRSFDNFRRRILITKQIIDIKKLAHTTWVEPVKHYCH